MSKIERNYGWQPDLPDYRDFKYSVPRHISMALPPSEDLRPNCPPVYDQSSLGSCTGNSVAGAHHYGQIKQVGMDKAFAPSRLMIYFNERDMEGDIGQDNGAQIRDGIKSVVDLGVCPESMWPYDISKFTFRPSDDCYVEALKHQVTSYMRVDQSLSQLKGCLAEGYPFCFGFSVYSSFESDVVAANGMMPMPSSRESCLGGHAVLCVGFRDDIQRFIVRNSWSDSWGDKGYFYMPYSYMTDNDLADDFWTIRLIEE